MNVFWRKPLSRIGSHRLRKPGRASPGIQRHFSALYRGVGERSDRRHRSDAHAVRKDMLPLVSHMASDRHRAFQLTRLFINHGTEGLSKGMEEKSGRTIREPAGTGGPFPSACESGTRLP
ncbi:MAG: hypothetical protein MZV64_02675 [Ignavibacteriales bacterium]|nr:hypothetical protein [Ignavibacteriales bacterium]